MNPEESKTTQVVEDQVFITEADLKTALVNFGVAMNDTVKKTVNEAVQNATGANLQDTVSKQVIQQIEEVLAGEQFKASALPQQTAWMLQLKKLVAGEIDSYLDYRDGIQGYARRSESDQRLRSSESWDMTRAAFWTKLLDANDASEAKKTLGLIGSYVGVENAFDTDLEAQVQS
jgi:hypothetical protein